MSGSRDTMIQDAGRVVVLLGGQSAEREISLLSGTAVLEALQSAGVDAHGLDVSGDWVPRLLALRPDRVFIMLHGRGGEDGTVQGLLECLRIPYTGSGVLASALALDKARSKRIWLQCGVPTAPFVMLDERTDWPAVIRQFGKVVVKPVNEGSSIGMSIVETGADLAEAYRLAARHDATVMAERHIAGDEFTVALLGAQVLPAIQLQTDHAFFDFDAKYVATDTRYLCPAPVSQADLTALESAARDAFIALGCEGWGRVDVMRDTDGRFYVLEVNTLPGMTSHSLVPMAAREAGLDFVDLVLAILFAKTQTGSAS